MTEDDARRQPPEEPTTAPPAGEQATAPPPPPPGTYPPPAPGSGFASRYGLVRPSHGRYVAGVCAAIGRATNTDPVLWRVLFAVLGLFGGVGVLAYLVCWLAIPADTDTASPIEALLGKGRSNTSPALVIVLAVATVVIFGFIVTDGFRAALLGAGALIVGALVLSRTGGGGAATAGGAPGFGGTPAAGAEPGYGGPGYGTPGYGGPGYGGPGYPGAGYGGPGYGGPGQPAAAPGAAGAGSVPPGGYPSPGSGPAGSTSPADVTGAGAGPWGTAGGVGAGAAATEPVDTPPAPTGGTAPYRSPAPGAPVTAPLPPMRPAPGVPPPGYRPPSGYRPPFAPHGPYASRGYPPPAPPAPPKPPKPPRERSALGAATFSLIFVALGLMAVLDLTDVISSRPSTYFAAALGTVALGLLVGAWLGRARWLIALGLPLALALGISTAVEQYDRVRSGSGSVVWQPATFADLGDRYEQRVGDATLDLTRLDFTGRDQRVTVDVNAGTLRVTLPPTVDTRVSLEVNVGEAVVFGRHYNGIGNTGQISDDGPDGPGGGTLTLVLHVNIGSLEVHR
ncbi:PspC domain-containing protein [Rhizomonospora bruguierae]|uniref:PspC domain-containing protein n=1 Tax=Rhizomonospora bruguierae TaxID=1581705 RepID=UPI001BCAC2F3|nr:PspC domain-containing protein [Micromonospora sp. NBRC 107566]